MNNTSKIQLDNIRNFSDLMTNVGITIPLIQRDYVQGRIHDGKEFEGVDRTENIQLILKKHADEREKRDNYVHKMIDALCEPTKNEMHLTFIYGKQQAGSSGSNCHTNSFVPLDGQQRLTSLALLSWVLRRRLSEDERISIESHQKYEAFFKGLDSFKYETRPSSNEFCSQLFSTNLLPESDELLSKQIKEQPWFNDSWNKDPSVKNMLMMLEFMDKELEGKNNIKGMLTNMLEGKGIYFELLDMESLNLTDSLYIQMNGRGKQLTPFENWKSNFFKLIEEKFSTEFYDGQVDTNIKNLFGNSLIYLKDYFSYSIEQQWTNMLWDYCRKIIDNNEKLNGTPAYDENCYPVIDNYFMNIFTMLHEIFYYLEKGDGKSVPQFQDTVSVREDTFSKVENVKSLFAYLDIIDGIKKVEDFFDKLFFVTQDNKIRNTGCKVRLFDGKSINLIDRCCNDNDFNNVTRFLLYAILRYIREIKNYDVTPEMKSYVRQVRNCLENEAFLKTADASMSNTLKLNQAQKVDKKIVDLLYQVQNGTILRISQEHAEFEDLDFCSGNPKLKYLPTSNSQTIPHKLSTVTDVFHAFCELSEYEQVCLLIAFGYQGHLINSNCSHGPTYLFGGNERWGTIFMDDHKTDDPITKVIDDVVKEYNNTTSPQVSGANALKKMINDKKLEISSFNFRYYTLHYENFILAPARDNKPTLYFSLKGNLDGLDLYAIQRSPKPILARHTDPIVFATKEELKQIKQKTKTLYMSYSAQFGEDVKLNLFDPNDLDMPIAYFIHMPGVHGQGGWQYFVKSSPSIGTSYDLHETSSDTVIKDRIQAGVEFITNKFPDYNFVERN